MDEVTLEQLRSIMPHAAHRIETFVVPLTAAMQEFSITSGRRQAAFLAQVAHESSELRDTRELASGDAYEGRRDLGNTEPGDGPRFKGRGLLQITGRANYERCGVALGLGLLARPDVLEEPLGACRSAAWFWSTRKLNELADQDRFGSITQRINGGFNHIDERLAYWLTARKVLGL